MVQQIISWSLWLNTVTGETFVIDTYSFESFRKQMVQDTIIETVFRKAVTYTCDPLSCPYSNRVKTLIGHLRRTYIPVILLSLINVTMSWIWMILMFFCPYFTSLKGRTRVRLVKNFIKFMGIMLCNNIVATIIHEIPY